MQALLLDAGLPVAGLTEQFPSAYVVARTDAALLAVAGLEPYGSAGLLRSLAVAERARSKGLGRRLVEDRLSAAHALGLERVFLLTTTAAAYFERLGFERVRRDTAPAELAASTEFAHACPASAVCMARSVGA